MTIKRITKAIVQARVKFRAAILQIIMDRGAMPLNRAIRKGFYDYTIPTPIGDLGITINDNWIPCGFENLLCCGSLDRQSLHQTASGNHHYSDDVAVPAASRLPISQAASNCYCASSLHQNSGKPRASDRLFTSTDFLPKKCTRHHDQKAILLLRQCRRPNTGQGCRP